MSDWFTRVNDAKNNNKDTTCKIDKKMYEFYNNYYSGIKSFER